jgi:hypothetical protein
MKKRNPKSLERVGIKITKFSIMKLNVIEKPKANVAMSKTTIPFALQLRL